MNVKLALLAAAGTFALISGAHAQDNQGYYGTIGAGVALENETDFESDISAPAAFDSQAELDSNIAVFGALGKYFENGFRGEVELASRSQNIEALPGDGIAFAGFPSGTELGEQGALTLMANVYKDFNLDAAGRISPYLGIGAGVARVRTEVNNVADGDFAFDVADMAVSNIAVVEDTEFVPAFQGLAGLTFDFTDNMMFTAGYRFLATSEFEHDAYINGPETKVSGEYQSHELLAGLRWNWGAPAPVAAPAPAPVTMKTCFDGSRIPVSSACPAQMAVAAVTEVDPLIVYFDYDKASLSSASEQLISAKVSEVMEGDLSAVSVSGNTDTVGSSAYNQALSARRAAVVRDALVSRGISANVISVEALGESNPARATGDGVKEPLNRRTEVEFSF